MDSICKHCAKSFHAPSHSTRDGIQCPHCGAQLEDPPEGIIEVTEAGIPRDGAKTISGLIRKRGLGKGVRLDDSTLLEGIQGGGEEKYTVGKQIAAGGMGAILDAQDTNLLRRVAMKVMKHPDRVSDDYVARFIEEAQITGQLQHPGIVPVHELGVDAQNRPFYTMKLLKGRTFQDILDGIRNGEPETSSEWKIPRLVNAFARVCEAMQFAHSRRVIHRDLKPENIMTGAFGEVQVLDWGLAKVLGRDAEGSTEGSGLSYIHSVRADEKTDRFQSMDGTVAGTPHYMAPEQASGRINELDERTDIYALGAILYQTLTLARPVNGPTVQALLAAVRRGKIDAPDDCPEAKFPHCPNQRPPAALSAIAMKALSRQPGERYQTVRELLQDIEAYQGGFATEAEGAGYSQRALLLLKRHKLATILSSFLLSAILAGAGISIWQGQRAVAALNRAEAEEEKRVATERESAMPRLNAARVLIREGDYENAEKALSLVKEYDPSLNGLFFDMALLYTRQAALAKGADRKESLQKALDHLEMAEDGEDSARLRRVVETAIRQPHLDFPLRVIVPIADRASYALLAAEFTESSDEQLARYRTRIERDWPGQGNGLTRSGNGQLAFEQVNSAPRIFNLDAFKRIPLTSFKARPIAFASLEPLRGMPLKEVRLTGPNATLRSFTGLEESPVTRLVGGSLNLGNLEELSDFTALRELDLGGCSLGRDVSFQYPPNLSTLNIRFCKKRDGQPFRFRDFPMDRLKSLNIGHTDTEVPSLEEMSSSTLHSFSIEQLSEFADIELLSQATNLVSVNGSEDWLPIGETDPIDSLLAGERLRSIEGAEEILRTLPARPWADKFREEVSLFRSIVRDGPGLAMRSKSKYIYHFNDSTYIRVYRSMPWPKAKRLAELLGGHLAACETKEEAEFISSNLPHGWLGGESGDGLSMRWSNHSPWSVDIPTGPQSRAGYLALTSERVFRVHGTVASHRPIIEFKDSHSSRKRELTQLIEHYLPVDPEKYWSKKSLVRVEIRNQSSFVDQLERRLIPGTSSEECLDEIIQEITAPGFLSLRNDVQWIRHSLSGKSTAQSLPPISMIGLQAYKNRVYLPVKQAITHSKATRLARCLGATLASSGSLEKNEWIRQQLPNQLIWLGGSNEASNGHWIWENGDDWEWTNWVAEKPKSQNSPEQQLLLRPDGEWVGRTKGGGLLATCILEWIPGKVVAPPKAGEWDSLLHCIRIPQPEYRTSVLQKLAEATNSKSLKAEALRCLALSEGDPPKAGRHLIDCREYGEGFVIGCIPLEFTKLQGSEIAKALGGELACLDHDAVREWVAEEFGKDYSNKVFRLGAYMHADGPRWDNGKPWMTDHWSPGEPNASGKAINLLGSTKRWGHAMPGSFDDDRADKKEATLIQWGDPPIVAPNTHVIRSPFAQVEILAMNPSVDELEVENGSAFTRWLVASLLDGLKQGHEPTAVIAHLRTSLLAPALADFEKDLDLFDGLIKGTQRKPKPEQAGFIPWLSYKGNPVLWAPNNVPRTDAEKLADLLGGTLLKANTPEALAWIQTSKRTFTGDRLHVAEGSIALIGTPSLDSKPVEHKLGSFLIGWE